MSEKHGWRDNKPGTSNGHRKGPHSNWDGSLHPDVFMRLVEAGTVKLTPTDKNYKVYIEGSDPEDPEQPFFQDKFYFEHLSVEQRVRFIELVNEQGVVNYAFPGYFYTTPFFAGRIIGPIDGETS